MARFGTLLLSVLAVVCVGLLTCFPAAVLGQSNPNIESIMATSDSLAFGTAVTDSTKELAPEPEGIGGIMGLISRSKLGQTGLGDLYVRGGVFMHWLFLAAVIGVAYIIERFWTLRQAKTNTRKLVGTVITTLRTDGVEAAAIECQKVRGPVAAILHAGLQKADQGPEAMEKAIAAAGAIELAFLERGLNWLTSVINIAPLIGFLGTVSGMIHAFQSIARADQVSAKLVAAGISEALITTAAGLIIAIPCALAYNYFVATNDRFVTEMEQSAGELIEAVGKLPK